MNLRFGELYEGGFYHIYNRGTEKKIIFHDRYDIERFVLLIRAINSEQNINSIKDLKQGDISGFLKSMNKSEELVNIFAFALVKNHFHFVLRQNKEDGVSTFMQKLCAGYARYYNCRYERVGTLFQGRFKYTSIKDDIKLMRLISYVNRNHEVHNGETDNQPTYGPPRTVSGHVDYLQARDDSFLWVDEGLNIFGGVKRYMEISTSEIEKIISRRAHEKEEGLLE